MTKIRTAQARGRTLTKNNKLWSVAVAEPDYFYTEPVTIVDRPESEVLAAFELYEALRAHGIETVAQVDALAASQSRITELEAELKEARGEVERLRGAILLHKGEILELVELNGIEITSTDKSLWDATAPTEGQGEKV